jgi:hypothetical protein
LIEFAPPRQLKRYTAPLFENSKRAMFGMSSKWPPSRATKMLRGGNI